MALATKPLSKIIKVNDVVNVDEGHGLVFGMAIVCKIADATGELQDYYDLNVDQAGVHKGKRIPENITEDAMFKCAVDAATSGVQMAGNVEHEGDDAGSYYFMFPVTTDIAKALGWTVQKTGLAVAYKPTPEVLQGFKDGLYTGFSIEGARVDYVEADDGN